MDVNITAHAPPRPSQASLLVATVAFAMVVFVFVADWFTPEIVAVGLAYEAPVVLAGLKGGSRSLTYQVIALGLAGIGIGWFMDLAAASYHFSAERIENRLLSVVSLLIVGSLTLMVQDARKSRSS